jgi:hypothetical protein
MNRLPSNAIHFTFIFFAVFDLRKYHLLCEIIFWALACASSYYLGSSYSYFSSSSTTSASATTPAATATATVTESVAAPAAPNKKTPPLGIQILQARWGTTKKDIDVTQQVQELIVQDEDTTTTTRFTLSIPKSFNFNQMFGDPAMFRRKYLRIVALVDGEPYVNAVYELRKKDFVLKSGRGAQDKEADSKAVEEQEQEQDKQQERQLDTTNNDGGNRSTTVSTITTTASNSTSTSMCHPVVSNIEKTYKAMSAVPFQNQSVEMICEGAEVVGEFIGLFGTSFLPVRANVTDNVSKIRAKCHLIVTNDPQLSLTTIGEYIGYERARHDEKKEGSVTLSMLWLKRALDFLDLYLKKFIHGDTSKDAARVSFENTLAPYQGWFLRTTCKTALKMVPSREKLGTIIMLANVEAMYWDQIVNEELKMLMSSFSVVVHDMDSWYDQEGLDFKDRA